MESKQEELKKRLNWLLILRLFIFVFIFISTPFILRSSEKFLYEFLLLYGITTLGFFLALSLWRFTHKKVSLKFLCTIHSVVEILTELAIIHYSGGISSPFVILLFFTIISTSFFLEMGGTLLVTTFASASLVALVFLEAKGVLTFESGFLPASHYSQPEYLFYLTYIYVCFFYIVALLAGYISNKLRARINELELLYYQLMQMRMDTDEILEYMRNGLVTVDTTGKIQYFNEAASKILGLDKSELRDRDFREVFPDRLRTFREMLERSLSGSMNENSRGEIIITSDEGKEIPLLLVTSTLKVAGIVRGVITVFEDITQEKLVDEYLKNVDKMALIGEMSAGLAHEIRNPLASIRGSVELLNRELSPPESENRELFELIVKETDRLKGILDEFLNFARIEDVPLFQLPFVKTDLSKLFRETLELLKRNSCWDDRITVVNEFEGKEFNVYGREDHLKQLFLNLLINAVEAVKNEKDPEIQISLNGQRQGLLDRNIILAGISIKDNGVGISEKNLLKIFQPFFSTKPKGTGLGLSIAQRIATQHKGLIEVHSKAGSGSEFVVFLPIKGVSGGIK